MSKKQSPIWDYFLENGDLVVCSKCPKTYKLATAKSSTQPLWYHMKTKHNILPHKPENKRSCADDMSGSPSSKRQKTIFSYVERKTQQQMYAELAAVDRLSLNQIANSSFIRNSMTEKGLKSHISPDTVRNKVFEFYEFTSSPGTWGEQNSNMRSKWGASYFG